MARPKTKFVDVITVDAFTVIYTSLSIILLAFFILLNSIAVLDPGRTREALGSLIGTFGSLPGGYKEVSGEGILSNPGTNVTKKELEQIAASLSSLLGEQGQGGDVSVFLRGKDVVISIEGKALFAEGSDEVLKPALPMIDQLAAQLRTTQREIIIEGHTDSLSTIRTIFPSDWMFGAARAMRVYDILVSKGIPPGQLRVASFGRTRPIMPNDTEHGRSRNRRIDIVIREGATDPMFRPKVRQVSIDRFVFQVPTDSAQEKSHPAPAGAVR